MKDFLFRLRRLLQSFFNGSRNYGCLPEDAGTPHPEQKVANHASNRPQSANSVEKDSSLR